MYVGPGDKISETLSIPILKDLLPNRTEKGTLCLTMDKGTMIMTPK